MLPSFMSILRVLVKAGGPAKNCSTEEFFWPCVFGSFFAEKKNAPGRDVRSVFEFEKQIAHMTPLPGVFFWHTPKEEKTLGCVNSSVEQYTARPPA